MSARSYEMVTRKQGNIQIKMVTPHAITVQLHGHTVVEAVYNRVTLSSCGYRTPTTKTAINRFFNLTDRNAHVIQRKHIWYVQIPNGTDKPILLPFIDGIQLNF